MTRQQALKILQYRGYGYDNATVKEAYEVLAELVDLVGEAKVITISNNDEVVDITCIN